MIEKPSTTNTGRPASMSALAAGPRKESGASRRSSRCVSNSVTPMAATPTRRAGQTATPNNDQLALMIQNSKGGLCE